MTRFQIRRDSVARPFLAIFGATEAKSYVEIDGAELHVQLGALFDKTIPLANVSAVERGAWSLWRGLGVRMSAGHGLGIVGSTEGIVRLRLTPRLPIKALFTFNCDEILFSLEDPDGFTREIEAHIASRKSADAHA